MSSVFSGFLFVTGVYFITSLNVALAQKTTFDLESHPLAPDYALESSWSSLPFRDDIADVLPDNEKWIDDSLKLVDVFYVHPTIYTKGPLWNADLSMRKVNRKVDKYPVRLQASAFNASCRVYAPRYRQSVVQVFYTPSEDGDKALDLAYSDVKRAFTYFLENHSDGRPFIIAGHSQGTYHTRRLLQEMIDTTSLRDRLVAAYIIGLTLNESMYANLTMSQNELETGCFITWQSFREGYIPDWVFSKNTQSINPLTWTTDTALVVRDKYAGTVVFNPRRIKKRKMEVRIADVGGDVLWIRTKAPWFRFMKNLHIADYGLFYMDIRKNVRTRVEEFLRH